MLRAAVPIDCLASPNPSDTQGTTLGAPAADAVAAYRPRHGASECPPVKSRTITDASATPPGTDTVNGTLSATAAKRFQCGTDSSAASGMRDHLPVRRQDDRVSARHDVADSVVLIVVGGMS
jgi:hypothetical protein